MEEIERHPEKKNLFKLTIAILNKLLPDDDVYFECSHSIKKKDIEIYHEKYQDEQGNFYYKINSIKAWSPDFFYIDKKTLEKRMGIKIKDEISAHKKNITLEEIIEELNKTVINQEQAKKTIAVAINDHVISSKLDTPVKKKNIILIGPTGVGKTLLAETAAKILNVGYSELNASNISGTGYIGGSLDDVFLSLITRYGKDSVKTRKAIIFLDEIDKLAGNDWQGFGKQIQNEMIGIVEGTTIKAITSKNNQGTQINTSEMLFFTGGAFTGLENIIAKRIGVSIKEYSLQWLYENATPQDLIEYGLKPELVGRFAIRAFLDTLSKEDYIRILKLKDGIIEQEKKIFEKGYGLSLEIEEPVYELMAAAAEKEKTGARALQGIAEQLLTPIKISHSKYATGNKLVIDERLARELLDKFLKKIYEKEERIMGFGYAFDNKMK